MRFEKYHDLPSMVEKEDEWYLWLPMSQSLGDDTTLVLDTSLKRETRSSH